MPRRAPPATCRSNTCSPSRSLPDTQQIRVQDKFELPASLRREGTEFTLSDKLTVTASEPAVERLPEANADGQARYRLPSARRRRRAGIDL